MYLRDISVPQAVKEIILSNDLYLKAVKSEIANYTAIANKIQPDVELVTGTRVNTGTIVVAIKRFADLINKSKNLQNLRSEDETQGNHLSGNNFQEQKSFISSQDARMKLTGSIIDIDLGNQNSFKNVNDLLNEFTQETLLDYNLIRTTEKIRIVTEDMFISRKVITSLTEKCNGKITEGLSRITITLFSDNILGIRQLLFNIFDVLNNYKITLNNVFFSSNEIVLILERDQAIRTYDLLQKKIFRN
ncbi:hypothetical protein [Candidatus Nitrosocosmicus arcticus]|uniref:ACT domain-containing protein n=1 Tax=Candidatus Nitrosocosmicus arcticus TaxID=2035267 RepID=A0A557SUM7_9ARCH|nr:hypothetical protein [Candidatus Nitrosocosmicus arcticus]TVP40314.1 hypothetical protein NARC_80040 [Candidatus Nitrosocosmicus arcticus]